MSLINQMLRDLDRRHAVAADAQLPAGQVRTVPAGQNISFSFWVIVAVLVANGLAWAGWVAYQTRWKPVGTPLAFQAAERARASPTAAPPAITSPPASIELARDGAPDSKPTNAAAPPAEPVFETFKLARLIETPISQGTTAPQPPAKPDREDVSKAQPSSDILPAPRRESAPQSLPSRLKAPRETSATAASAPPSVLRRDRPRSAADQAETIFRNGVSLLNQGRVSEAQDQFAEAIARDRSHVGARQALASILIDRERLDEARQVLQEGLIYSPGQIQFALVLARLLIERRDYSAAASVLAQAKEAGESDPEYQVLVGAVAQRLGRHDDAVAAFRKATILKPQPGATWLAMAMSLEATGRKEDALQAYTRAVDTNGLTPETLNYAETKIRSLR
jgi:MSHA biogenesis protein MshN